MAKERKTAKSIAGALDEVFNGAGRVLDVLENADNLFDSLTPDEEGEEDEEDEDEDAIESLIIDQTFDP